MQWSQMNSAQRAFLNASARFTKSTISNGRVVRPGQPMNDAARVVRACQALDRDAVARRNAEGKAAMDVALAAFTADELSLLATKFEAGCAYGAGELQRKHATAMPMRYFRGTQYGA